MTFTVTDNSDASANSLRAAITASNANAPGAGMFNTINFNIAPSGVQTINILSALPTITEPVLIDGYSETGASANTLANGDNAVLLIELNGAGAGANADGLLVGAGGGSNGGNVNTGAGNSGNVNTGTGNSGNVNTGFGNSGNVNTGFGNSGNVNTGVGNGGNGGAGNVGFGNSGNVNTGAGNGGNGGAGNVGGGGGSTVEGLAINRFSLNGIELQSAGNTISGNFIGTNPAGNAAEANSNDGIHVSNSANTIGGTTPAARNLVSGNAVDGIHIAGNLASPATNNVVEGNFVGTNAAGTGSVGVRASGAAAGTPEGNGLFGIEVSGGNSNTIGGTTAGARNVVGLNVDGIELDNGAQNNTVQGNFVGVGADGATPVGNVLHGVALRSDGSLSAPLGPGQPNEPGTSNNLIGGTAAGAGNLVEFNGTAGVAVFGNPVSVSNQPNVGNAILGNSIFENGRGNPTFLTGIDLSNQFVYPKDDGVTANDANGHGAANDPNNFQNFPVLASAVPVNGGGTTITGTLTQAVSPNTTFRIEFFASNADPMHGVSEGQTFLGFTNVTSNANGVASFSVSVPGTAAAGQLVTATATDPNNNTSEFSSAVVASFPVPVVSGVVPPGVPEGATANLTVNGTNFVSGSVVQLNGTPLTTSFVSDAQLTAVAPAALLTDEGHASLVVVNPSPGGGTSNSQSLGVLEALLPDGSQGTANQRFVAELYHDLLGRTVDPNGLAHWSAELDAGISRNAIVAGIEGALEYRTHVVETLYQTYLHRAADSQGLLGFENFLAGGGTDEQAAAVMTASPEYFQVRGGGTTDGFIKALFQDALGQPVQSGELTVYEQFLAGGGTRQQAANTVFSSAEYRQDLVVAIYHQFLDRQADSSGLSTFTSLLAHGGTDEQVIGIIAGSPEYYSKTA